MAKGPAGVSALIIEEAFASSDDRFLELIRQFYDPKALARIADRWKTDFRPWARQQILLYLDRPLNTPGHNVVVKRLFKHAEAQKDDELMGAFTAAFDRLVRRRLRPRHRYDWRSRQSWTEQTLFAPRNTTLPRFATNPRTKETIVLPDWPIRESDRLFSYHTRYYLQRRAWRYFRRMGFQRPADYPAAVAKALARYTDEDLPDGLAVLDSWGLVHACFGESDAVEFGVSHAKLKRAAQLGEMVAPYFQEAWQEPEAAMVLLNLIAGARSRIVRVWASQLLRRDHKNNLANVPLQTLLKLIDHADPEIQQLGAELLENAPGLDRLDVATWLRLLQTQNVTAVALLAVLMRKNVRPERLSLAETIDLARARPVPVARLGLEFLKARAIATPADRGQVARLALSQCEGVGQDLARFALSILGTAEHYDVDLVSRFFDSLLPSVRQGAREWLTPQSPGWNDAALWSRLIETPYDDVRLHLVAHLEQRARLPGLGTADLSRIWTPVLLAIHRGGRAKLTALRQISQAIKDDPQHAEALLPALAVAIRSVRLPEARAGLAAIVAAVEARSELAPLLSRFLPELVLEGAGA